MKKRVFVPVVIAGGLLLAAALTVLLVTYNREAFSGNRVATTDTYVLDIARMNGTDLHSIKADAGDTLKVHFETEKGALHLEIRASDGTVLYSGNGEGVPYFTVSIPAGGTCTVRVTARHAKGKIQIRLCEKTA